MNSLPCHPAAAEMCLSAQPSANQDQMFLSHPLAMPRFPSSDQMTGNPVQLER